MIFSEDFETDFNDQDPKIHPKAPELCDDTDNDCHRSIDEGFDLQNNPNNSSEHRYKCPEGFCWHNSECIPYIKQEIPLCAGWNLISFQINHCYYEGRPPGVFIPSGVVMKDLGTENDSMEAWLSNDANSPLRDDADPNKAGNWKRVISFDSGGAHIMDADIPPKFNTLKYISAGYGYWIKMNAPGTLVLEGEFLTSVTPLTLQSGWNLIGYIPPDTCYADIAQELICPYTSGVYSEGEGILYSPVDPLASSVFSSIAGKYRRIIAFDCCAGAMIYDTQIPIKFNTLHYIGPKFGYWIKIEDQAGAELTFPESDYGDIIWYVDGDVEHSDDGRSWDRAFKTIQEAINAAGAGNEIWVKEGTYVPGTARTDAFRLKPRISLYGGFDGSENMLNQRDYTIHKSIMSGDIGLIGDYNDNCYHVVIGADNAVIDGFTITEGNALGGAHSAGGGLYNE